jgi:uncharacterized repeat protein (TIGR04052 family)
MSLRRSGTWVAFAWAVAALGAAGCGSDAATADGGVSADVPADVGAPPDGGADAAVASEVTVRFVAKVRDLPFRCGATFASVGTSGGEWRPTDFRFYVHDLRLVTAAGEQPITLRPDGRWQNDSVALLDFEDRTGMCTNGTAETNTQVVGTLPPGATGAVTALRFRLGVPFALNHVNSALAASPLNLSTLWWNWQGGYKFVRIDGDVANAMNPAATSWYVHVGSTGCDGDATGGVTRCAEPNRVDVELSGFDPSRNTVVADLGSLLAESDVRVSAGAPGCMSGLADPECPPVLRALGIDVGGTPGVQRFFRVE